ncbi:Ubiquitin carboxyl-terminal hydrolase [Dirofilaria immitis]
MMKQKGRAAVVGFIHFHMAIDFAAKPDVLLHTSDTRFVEPPVIADGVSGKAKNTGSPSWSCGVVAITSASHAEGRRFEPGRDLWDLFIIVSHFGSDFWQYKCTAQGRTR